MGVATPVELSALELTRHAHARRGRLIAALARESDPSNERANDALLHALAHALETSDMAKPWSAAEDASLYVIASPAADRAHCQTPRIQRALDIISRATSENGSIADNPISTSLAYLATSLAGASSASASHLEYLDRARVDGTWRFCTTDIWDTALLLRSLLIGGIGAELIGPARAYLLERQNVDGGWPYAPGRSSDIDTTSMVLSVLAPDSGSARRRGRDHLLARRSAEGLWPTWMDKSDTIADDVTAHAIGALRAMGEDSAHYATARAYLRHRLSTGTWRVDWYDNHYYGIHELANAVEGNASSLSSLTEHVMLAQRGDGGFAPNEASASSPAATGCALAFLTRRLGADDPTVVRAFDYLVSRQDGDGTWPGPTGMVGPRPFVSDYPMQTHALALLGISELLREVDHT